MPVISKRKLKSYKRAEMLSQEVRRQFSSIGMRRDENQICEFLIYWMKVTGNIKYEVPAPPKKYEVPASPKKRFGCQL